MIPSIKELEEAYKGHDMETCKVDCCIFCYGESQRKEKEKIIEDCKEAINTSWRVINRLILI